MIRKPLILVLACVMASSWLWPGKPAEAAVISAIHLTTDKPYLVAGVKYAACVMTDKASSTSMTTTISYAPHTSNAWVFLSSDSKSGSIPWTAIHVLVDVIDSTFSNYDKCSMIIPFSIPLDSELTSVRIKVNSFFNPLIGSRSSSERVLGPYDVKQPGDPENLDIVTHEDGTVTLSWDDMTNMEKYYEISRAGPDGVEVFYVENTADYIGKLSYHDTKTDKKKSTLYLYKVTPILNEKYALPDHLKPGNISKLVKTTVPVKPLDTIKIINSGELTVNFKNSETLLSEKAKLDLSVAKPQVIQRDLGIYNNVIDKIGDINLNPEVVNQASVKSVSLDAAQLTLKAGGSSTLKATIMPKTAINQNVIWKSDNPAVATVDGSGKVQAVSEGTATIKVQTEDGGYSATCAVTVLPSIQFKDIQAHWAKDEIVEAVNLGFVKGYSDGTFRPEANVTREEFAVMLMRGLQSAAPGEPLRFSDSGKISNWAIDYVKQAVSLKIINGYTDGTFRPQANITHAEMMKMIVQASGLELSMESRTSFADDRDIPKWARPAVVTALSKGIIFGGISDNRFKPNDNAKRSEAASSIVRMLRL